MAAALLKKEGYQVIGAHMRCWSGSVAAPRKWGEPRSLNNERDGCAEQDAEDARRAAEVLGIPFYVFDFEKEYKNKVVNYMIDGYRKGITPNPDIMCNKEIKFGLFFKKAMEMGADYVATGHYVRLGFRIQDLEYRGKEKKSLNPKSYILYSARDKNKDQSYFLWTMTQDQLRHCLFPIGEYKKPQVRKLAKKFGLLNAEKKDSQGICFLGQVSLPDFLSRYIRPRVGAIINHSGETIGEHRGAHLYTIGQRHGLNIGGFSKPLYVSEKNVRKNVLVVAEGDDNLALYRKEINLTNVNLINSSTHNSLTVYARVRYRQPLAKSRLERQGSSFKLIFDKPQKFVASGQSAVWYDSNGVMLGGGVIV